MTNNDKNLSKDLVRQKGITKTIETFFFQFPHSSAKECCRCLDIPYKKYRRLCWKIKSETKELLEGKVEGRVLVPLVHREEFRVELPREVVDSVVFEAGRRRPGKVEPKPFDEWYVVPNRNRVCLLRNDYLTIRVWPKSGTCRVLPAKPLPYEWIKTAVQNALFKAGVDLGRCERTSETIETKSRSRIFKVGPVTPFKIDHYKQPLGLTIKADGSHPDFIECEEDWPSWIKPFLTAVYKNTEALNVLRTDFPAELNKVTSSFERSMQEHLDIIKTFRVESEARSQTFKRLVESQDRLLEALTINSKASLTLSHSLLTRHVRRKRTKKPKPSRVATLKKWLKRHL